VLKHLAVMCTVAAVLGVVVAGLAIPFAGLFGLSARDAAKTMDKLPANFSVGNLAQTTKIVDANGNIITTLYDQNRVYRPLSQISRKMTSAILSIEDYRFYKHGALDLKGTLRAFITNQADNGTVQGGSSITQQLVKMTLLYGAKTKAQQQAATDDSYARKLRELRYAIALEQHHSKDWILEHYLNAAYFGDGAYGIQSAAKHYFGVNADQLNWKQSATLAGLVKNPTGYDPTNYPDAAIARRNVVLDRMAQLHVISQARAEKLKKQGLGLHLTPSRNGCVNSTAPWFCDYTLDYLKHDPALGDTVEERTRLLYSGGLTIKTSLNLRYQQAADKAVHKHVYPNDPAIGAIAEVQPGTGDVLALSQSRPMGSDTKKGQTYLNYTIPQEMGGSAGFQGGSTFKLFVLATAITQGIPLSTTLSAPSPMTFNWSNFANCPGAGHFTGVDVKHNETGEPPYIYNLYTGTQQSINTFYFQLEERTGVCKPYNLAKEMGVHLTHPTGAGAERVPTFTLGVASVSPLEMAGAYATVAARGKYCEPKPVTEIDDSNGHVVKKYDDKCRQVMPENTADAVNDVLRGVQEPGPYHFGYEEHLNLAKRDGTVIPSAGKTGTTQNDQVVWFDGYTPQIATVAMIAGANKYGTPESLDYKVIAGVNTYTNASGSGFAGPMWGDAMHAIENTLKPINFHKPNPKDVKGVLIDVPSVTCESVSRAKAKLDQAGFHAVQGGTDWSSCPVGTVDYTSPSGQAPSASTITLITSKGPEPAPPPSPPKKNGGGNKSGGGSNGGGGGGHHGGHHPVKPPGGGHH